MSTRISKYLAKREKYGATHYKGNNKVVFEKGKGIYLMDVDGKIYIDAAAGYSSVNLGHNHPKICEAGRKLYEVDKDGWGPACVVPNSFLTVAQANFLEYSCVFLDADKALATNGGVEGVETALKLMLKWGYTKKKKPIPEDKAIILMFEGNFHGRTTTVISGSSEAKYKKHFGPYAGNILTIPYGDIGALDAVLKKKGRHVAGIVIEPIQGEGGVKIPPKGYLAECYALCKKHDVLFCADEIQTGLGRTGALLACSHENVDPDIFVLAKSLGAGKNAVAAVFAKDEFMCFEPGEHGSTYGGNTAAMTLAQTVLEIIKDEKLCENSKKLGGYLIEKIASQIATPELRGYWKDIRGRGLMIGIELGDGIDSENVIDVLLDHGVMTKDAHGVIRITPPLIITKKECGELARRIGCAFRALTNAKKMCGCKDKKCC
ncbi:MAG: aminotransferase class III-fold pyridoxal phosphate-dependent enzyme [bacterium]|nr:aminotransferase class III-fold pyridoxal phosphate-dependent enzyme [bacterium]